MKTKEQKRSKQHNKDTKRNKLTNQNKQRMTTTKDTCGQQSSKRKEQQKQVIHEQKIKQVSRTIYEINKGISKDKYTFNIRKTRYISTVKGKQKCSQSFN